MIVLVALLFASCASTRYRVGKTNLDNFLETNAVFRESHTGLLVYDIHEDKVLFDHNSQKHFTPASNTKLITYLTSLKMMPDSVPSLEYCLVHDTLYFTGTGDPTLLYPNFDYGKTMTFLSDQEDQLVYIPRTIEDARLGPGWSWDDYPYYYSAEKSTFPIYGNLAHFQRDSLSEYVEIIPDIFDVETLIQKDSVEKNNVISRKEFENQFEVRIGNDSAEIEEVVPFLYSDDLFVKLLSDTLKKQVVKQKVFPDCHREILFSVPTDSIARHILIESDNFLAEQMLLLISSQLSDTLSSKNAIKSMMENEFAFLEDEIYWIDGSGLSRYNQVTPHAMIEVLKMIFEEVPQAKLQIMLPEAGASGTLEKSFLNLSDKIYAKTGSMSHVYCLSGFMKTNSGKTLLFSFMNNNFNVSFSELKSEMERVLAAFVND